MACALCAAGGCKFFVGPTENAAANKSALKGAPRFCSCCARQRQKLKPEITIEPKILKDPKKLFVIDRLGLRAASSPASEFFFADPLEAFADPGLNPQGERPLVSACERKWPWAQDLLLSLSNNIFRDGGNDLARVCLMKIYLRSSTKPERLSNLQDKVVTLSISQIPRELLCRGGTGCKKHQGKGPDVPAGGKVSQGSGV